MTTGKPLVAEKGNIMFASFAQVAGFAAQWQVASEEQFVRRTLSGDVGAVASMLETIGATIPAPVKGSDEKRVKGVTYTPHGKVAMIRYLDDPLTRDAKVIRGHASGAWALFCAAASAALKGDRTLCDTFDADCAASHAALKAAANKARADKAAAPAAPAADPVAAALSAEGVKLATIAPAAPAAPAAGPVAPAAPAAPIAPIAPTTNPVAAALDIVNAAVNAGTLTAEQCGMLRSMVERLAIKV